MRFANGSLGESLPKPVAAVCDRRRGAENRTKAGGHSRSLW